MYGYIRGVVEEINSNYIIIDNNDIGYQIYVPNPYSYQLNKTYTIYIYTKVAEEEYTLYGFRDKEQKELFLKLISVKGLGPKMALPILAMGNLENIANAVENNNLNYLKKFPKIGDKVARQIILDLKGKLVSNNDIKVDNSPLIEALKSLGYKVADINKVLPNVDKNKDIGLQIKEALRLMLK